MSVAFSQPALSRSTRSFQGCSDRIALLDRWGTIVAVNESWTELGRQTGAAPGRVEPGANYLEICRQASPLCPDAREALAGIRSVLCGKSRSFVMDYMAALRSGPVYFRMAVTPFCHGEAEVAIVHTDITELQLSKEKSLDRVREFARRLVNAQEEERERIAKDMHDDLGNRIALLSFSVQGLINRRNKEKNSPLEELADVLHKITDLSFALRQLSHCLHPHLLRNFGIGVALKVLCDEFAKTTGIRIETIIPENVPHLPEESGLCMFRVTQECLHNIAKHSAAAAATLILERTSTNLRLTVSDNGRGFLQSVAWNKAGLGLTSMKERVLSLRGQLEIRSAPGAGTEVRVTIPAAGLA